MILNFRLLVQSGSCCWDQSVLRWCTHVLINDSHVTLASYIVWFDGYEKSETPQANNYKRFFPAKQSWRLSYSAEIMVQNFVMCFLCRYDCLSIFKTLATCTPLATCTLKKFQMTTYSFFAHERRGSLIPRLLPMPSLVPRLHPVTRKGVWWPLSNFLVVPSQQSWYWTTQWNSTLSCNHVLDQPTYL